ncbi:NK-lysin tandem duplicate 4 [Cheilinus undulatus]|uniref:NK-lysin tandem duplicate 4 n=1 Tax=Cheilinus undulatus TaxID=241271 RepID=UPI001BD5B123|nr:NK-lysin tandem duplicate 4 [Cheilinus undulatus]
MVSSSVLLVCLLVTCSVWMGHGASVEVRIDDQEPVDLDGSVGDLTKIPGVCWACKWALKKVKKVVGQNGTAEVLKSKLLTCCDEIGLLRSLCRRFVKKHLGELIEELTTTDDVRTICVNTGACKPKELLSLHFYQTEEKALTEVNEYA